MQTIQNGLGSPEIAAPILGSDRIAIGVVGGFGASVRAPGHVHHNGMEMIRFGAYAGLPKQLLQASAKIWESAGFKVAPSSPSRYCPRRRASSHGSGQTTSSWNSSPPATTT